MVEIRFEDMENSRDGTGIFGGRNPPGKHGLWPMSRAFPTRLLQVEKRAAHRQRTHFLLPALRRILWIPRDR